MEANMQFNVAPLHYSDDTFWKTFHFKLDRTDPLSIIKMVNGPFCLQYATMQHEKTLT